MLSSQMSTHRNASDSRDSHIQNEGCLGGNIGRWLNGVGTSKPKDPLTASSAVANDDPTILVANELNKLSVKEREVVFEDIHGVSMVDDESNLELVNKHLYDMTSELDKIPRFQKVAYLLAMEDFGQKGKDFCQDRDLHLMFLRAARWNSKKAAERFVGWMDWKLKLFDRGVLCHRHVTLDKLEKGGRAGVQSGRIQILPQRDTTGRTVVFSAVGHHSESGSRFVKDMLQMFWYMAMASIEDDVQAQRMGIVYVIYTVGGTPSLTSDDRQVAWDCSRMISMLPVRINSVHYCLNNPALQPLISLLQTSSVSHLRVRFRCHGGSHTEVQYSLMSYGVPGDVLPITDNGNIKNRDHLKWCKRRKARDSKLADRVGGGRGNDFYGIDLPGRLDVLVGKGKNIGQHLGNRRLQELVSRYFQEYDTALYGDKYLVADKLLRLISGAGSGASMGQGYVGDNSAVTGPGALSRFLKRRDDGWWEPVTYKEAVEKVCHSFRAFRSSQAKKTSTTGTPMAHRGTGERTILALSTGNNDTTTGTKRIKVETQEGVKTSGPLIPSEPSLSMREEGNNEEQLESFPSFVQSRNDATTTGDDGLDLDRFDWGI